MCNNYLFLIVIVLFFAITVLNVSAQEYSSFGQDFPLNINGKCNATCANNATMSIKLNIPICRTSCINGQIVEPGICKCNTGYKLSRNYTFVCNPIASRNIRNNQYNCNITGYVFNGNECIPECKNCISGICLKPNTCKCLDPNIKLYNGSFCNTKCPEFSHCEDPSEMCKCMEGYEKNGHHSCKPECSSGCHYGTCVKPNVCKCIEGWGGNTCFDQKNDFESIEPTEIGIICAIIFLIMLIGAVQTVRRYRKSYTYGRLVE